MMVSLDKFPPCKESWTQIVFEAHALQVRTLPPGAPFGVLKLFKCCVFNHFIAALILFQMQLLPEKKTTTQKLLYFKKCFKNRKKNMNVIKIKETFLKSRWLHATFTLTVCKEFTFFCNCYDLTSMKSFSLRATFGAWGLIMFELWCCLLLSQVQYLAQDNPQCRWYTVEPFKSKELHYASCH